nr:primase alpha helix C-terminal domain-containing protein [Ammoniphilus oxalaticus]
MQGIREGNGRNPAAASIAGHLFRKYVDPILIYEIMVLWNERNSPPMDIKELNKIVDSIAKKEIGRRGG